MIPFIDLQAQRLRLAGKIEAAVQEAVVGGAWVMGPQVRQFEADLAAFGQAKQPWAAPTAPTPWPCR